MAANLRGSDEFAHAVRNRAAVVSGLASLIAEEVRDAPRVVTRGHLEYMESALRALKELLAREPERGAGAAPGPGPAPAEDLGPARPILVVEDDDDHFVLLQSLLARPGRGGSWQPIRARTLGEARTVLAGGTPVCSLVDLGLPDSERLDTLVQLRAVDPFQPMVVVTGSDSSQGLEAVRLGAQDYLMKGNLSGELLDRAIDYAIERARFEAQLVHQALHDAMTGLANRTLLFDRLALATARLHRHPAGRLALMLVDLDRFKIINDSLGHAVGDELLVEVARRLQRSVRTSDTVARVGGDEFVVLFEELRTAGDVARQTEQLLRLFEEPFECSMGPHLVSASIGVVTASGDEDITPEALLANADTAMYRAKEQGRRGWELFDKGMRARLVNLFEIERELGKAVDRGELEVWYQPVVEASTGRVLAAEALVRWRHPSRGLLAPGVFLPVAEDSGRVVQIGEWVLGEAAAQASRWAAQDILPEGFVMWVNVSSRQLEAPERLERDVADVVARADPGWQLGLELTEGALIRDVERAARILETIRSLGCRVAIDDFGTGFSSLTWLQRLPIDQLKIDGSFVADLSSPANEAIVEACISLARALHVGCTAEGVEQPEQLAWLVAMGCGAAQGFLFSPPARARSAEALLRAGPIPTDRGALSRGGGVG